MMVRTTPAGEEALNGYFKQHKSISVMDDISGEHKQD
jgi:hypothetical protein